MKRLWIATVIGFLTGLFCIWGASARGQFGTWILVSTVANRTLIGFAIGISKFKMHWALHGVLMGAIFGLPLSFAALQNGVVSFLILEIASIIYGFTIELVTTVVLKAKA